MEKVICQYCKNVAPLVTGKEIYPHRKDLYSLKFYQCVPCDAFVGCHPGTENPLGCLANEDLRYWRRLAHTHFDPVWKKRLLQKQAENPKYKKGMARGGRYKKLAEILGIERRDCHIGMFDIDLCKRTIDACQSGALND